MTVPNLMIDLHIRIAVAPPVSAVFTLFKHSSPFLGHKRYPISSFWLQYAHLKSVTKTLIVATQDQALNTDWLGNHILRTSSYFRFVLTVFASSLKLYSVWLEGAQLRLKQYTWNVIML